MTATATRHIDADTPVAAATFVDLVDDVTEATLRSLLTLTPPVVSIHLPTHRAHPNLTHDALVLRGLVDSAEGQARSGAAQGVDGIDLDIDDVLAPVRQLVTDRPFWAEQGDGLTVIASADGYRTLRLPIAPEPTSRVGDRAHLVPLLPLLDGYRTFYVLALSLGQVRLFRATATSIEQLELGSIPASVNDIRRNNGREPQLQHQHQPRSSVASFHGHGGTDADDIDTAHFLREVAEQVRARLGADTSHPIVLASVTEHFPALAATGLLPTLLPDVVAGNPDATPAHDLLEAARAVVQHHLRLEAHEWREKAIDFLGTRAAADLPDDVATTAAQGRVETLLVEPTAAVHADLDQVVADVLAHGGRLRSVPDLPAAAVALLRY